MALFCEECINMSAFADYESISEKVFIRMRLLVVVLYRRKVFFSMEALTLLNRIYFLDICKGRSIIYNKKFN